jgi:hypothetical protein
MNGEMTNESSDQSQMPYKQAIFIKFNMLATSIEMIHCAILYLYEWMWSLGKEMPLKKMYLLVRNGQLQNIPIRWLF